MPTKKHHNKTISPAPQRRRRIAAVCVLLFVAGVLAVLAATDVYVGSFYRASLFDSLADVPHRRAALVLGCSPYTHGRPNLFYHRRLDAAAELWHAGKIDAVLVSGDHSRKDYDEPAAMKADLVKRGVPAEYIAADYAGFRTLDSVVRADAIFGLNEYIIVSQPFHCQRAIYLARQQGQSVIGYCAADISGRSGLKVRLRETPARAAAVVDVLLSRRPRYLGRQEQLHYRPADDRGETNDVED